MRDPVKNEFQKESSDYLNDGLLLEQHFVGSIEDCEEMFVSPDDPLRSQSQNLDSPF